MNDQQTVGFLKASCWEHMAGLCEEHYRAERELEGALLEQFISPSVEADVRALVAEVALRRAEGRLR